MLANNDGGDIATVIKPVLANCLAGHLLRSMNWLLFQGGTVC